MQCLRNMILSQLHYTLRTKGVTMLRKVQYLFLFYILVLAQSVGSVNLQKLFELWQ